MFVLSLVIVDQFILSPLTMTTHFSAQLQKIVQVSPLALYVILLLLLIVRLWSLQTFTALVCFKGHNYPVWGVEFRYSTDSYHTLFVSLVH